VSYNSILMDKKALQNSLELEILMSTMDKTSLSFLGPIFPSHDIENLNILIVNQTSVGKELHSDYKNIRVINSYEKGLSKSRNLAIQNAIGNICLLADDDIEYLPNFENTIKKGFENFDKAAVITFKIDTFTGEAYKTYPQSSKRLTAKKELRTSSSVEMAFKREAILFNEIMFNVNFGLGSHFPSGEEYLFLKKVRQKGLPIYFENKAILRHKLLRSTSNMASENFIRTQAAIYYVDYKLFSYVALLKFIVYLVRTRQISINTAMKNYKVGLDGIKSFKRLKHGQ